MTKDDEYMHEINRLEGERDYWRCMHAKVDTECAVLRREVERLRAALTEMEQMHETLETENNERGREIERTRHLAGALLDRVMELDPVATVWRESLIERWPWLECGRDAAGGA